MVVEMIKEENDKMPLRLNNRSPTDKNKTQILFQFYGHLPLKTLNFC